MMIFLTMMPKKVLTTLNMMMTFKQLMKMLSMEFRWSKINWSKDNSDTKIRRMIKEGIKIHSYERYKTKMIVIALMIFVLTENVGLFETHIYLQIVYMLY